MGLVIIPQSPPVGPVYLATLTGSNQSLGGSLTQQRVVLNTVNFDTASASSNGGATYTPKVKGLYEVSVMGVFLATNTVSSAAEIVIYIFKNGSTLQSAFNIETFLSLDRAMSMTYTTTCNGSTDNIEFWVAGNPTNTFSLSTGAFMSISLIQTT